jgi:hypothetical protein
MFSKTLTQAGHVRRFVVSTRPASGWEVRIEQDREVVRQAAYRDWHRLERAMGAIEREVRELVSQGWEPLGDGASTGQSMNR